MSVGSLPDCAFFQFLQHRCSLISKDNRELIWATNSEQLPCPGSSRWVVLSYEDAHSTVLILAPGGMDANNEWSVVAKVLEEG